MFHFLTIFIYLMKNLTLLILFSFFLISSFAQKITDNKLYGLTYKIFQLDSTQARVLYSQNKVTDTVDLFTHLHSVQYTDSTFDIKRLPKGHYLIAKASGTNVHYETYESEYFEIRTYGYNGEAWIFISDYKGNILKDAELTIKGDKYAYREDCNCYPVPDLKGNGWAKVAFESQFTYINIDGFKAPKESFKKNKNDYSNKVFSATRILPGYIAFNQPKYQLDDTVKTKAFLVKENGKPWKRKVKFKVYDIVNENKLAFTELLSPVTDGAFVYDFAIPDTFDIDQFYKIVYTTKRNKVLKYEQFRVEDYQLGNTTFKAIPKKDAYFAGEKPTYILEGKDANGLPLLDGFAEIKITLGSLKEHYRDTIFIDKDWYKSFYETKILLDVSGPTYFEIPDSIFPIAKCTYTVSIKMNNSENEPKHFSFAFSYDATTEHYELSLKGDTLKAEYFYNSKITKECKGTLLTYYNNTLIEEKEINFPHYEKLNYESTHYILKDQLGNQIGKLTSPNRINQLVYPIGKRTHDSINISLHNEIALPISWQIYKGKNKITGGRGATLNYTVKDESLDSYYIIYNFRWQNQDFFLEKGFHIKEKQLNVEVDQPETVFPGSIVPISVSVTDYKNEAMKDVNLTAWSVNMKFGNIPSPELPYFGLNHYNILRWFSVSYKKFTVQEKTPIKEKHIELLGLYDTPYYRFIYNKSGVDQEFDSIHSEWSEFTPYVYTNGQVEKIFTVYVNDEPIYIDNPNLYQPLSFKKKSGKYEVKVRTKDHIYKIKNVELKRSMKTFVCLNSDSALNNMDVEYLKLDSIPFMITEEDYLMPKMLIANFYRNGHVYLEQDSLVVKAPQNLYGRYYDQDFGTFEHFGPFKKGKINVTDVYNDTTYSFYFEPGYLYSFTKDTSYVSQPIVYPNPLKSYYPSTYSDTWSFQTRSFVAPKVKVPKSDPKIDFDKKVKEDIHRKPKMHPLLKTRHHQGNYSSSKSHFAITNTTRKAVVWTGIFSEDNDSCTHVKFGNFVEFSYVKPGKYDIFVMLQDSSYVLLEDFNILRNGDTYFRYDASYLKQYDPKVLSKYEDIIIRLNKPEVRKFKNPPVEIKGFTTNVLASKDNKTMMSGYMFNHKGEPMDYVTILAEIAGYFKGGAITNSEGYFEIHDIPSGNYMLKIRLQNNGDYTIYNIKVAQGKHTQITIEPEILFEYVNSIYYNQNEVLSLIDGEGFGAGVSANYSTNNDSYSYSVASLEKSSASIRGSRSEISAVIVSREDIAKMPERNVNSIASTIQVIPGVVSISERAKLIGKEAIEALKVDENSNRIRTNFRDYGFWQPNLVTGKDGKVHFSVQYPDNITQWKTIVPAMDGNKNTGIGYAQTKSFKPLSANLGLPNFLIQNDMAVINGKVLNYTEEAIGVKTYFDINGIRKYTEDQNPTTFSLDKFSLTYDSVREIKVTFGLDKGDGYIDGEERKLNILVNGVKRTSAQLLELDNDTSFILKPDTSLTGRTLFITNDPFDLIKRELEELKAYNYLCNEQTASKIKALLLEKKFLTNLNEEFKEEKLIRQLIKDLEKNQNEDGSWGWWNKSAGDTWITSYVTEAMNLAVSEGYRTKAHMNGAAYLKANLYNLGVSDKLEALNVLASIPYPMDYNNEIKKVGNYNLSLQDRFQYLKLLQSQDSIVSIDTILNSYEVAKKGIFWGEQLFNVKVNTMQTSLLAYQVLKKAGGNEELLKKVRTYFLNYKPNTKNTIEQANMLQEFMEDMLLESNLQAALTPEIKINNSVAGTNYPIELKFKPEQEIKFEKTGAPVNIYNFEHRIESNPSCSDSLFKVSTKFMEKGKEVSQLTAGEPITMEVEVIVKKSSQYVLMEIPIPAACSYGGDLPQTNANEEHRKKYDHMTSIACRNLSAGRHKFYIQLIPRFEGSFSVLPASVGLMYYPDVTYYSPSKKVEVEDKK